MDRGLRISARTSIFCQKFHSVYPVNKAITMADP